MVATDTQRINALDTLTSQAAISPSPSTPLSSELIADLPSWGLLPVKGVSETETRSFSHPRADGAVEIIILKSASVVGLPQACVILKDQRIIEESMPGKGLLSETLKDIKGRLTPGTFKDIQGDCCLLCGHFSTTFWHSLIEYLPRVALSEAVGFKGKYVVPAGGIFKDVLGLLGIGDERILEWGGGGLKVERLWVSPLLDRIPPGPALFTAMQLNRDLLRAGIDKNLQLMTEQQPDLFRQQHDRLFLVRENPERPRRILNQEAVYELVREYGFKVFDMESLPVVQQQMALASRAKVIAGPHGAAIGHCAVMNPNTTVIEICGPNVKGSLNLPICQSLGINHHKVSRQDSAQGDYDNNANIQVDLDELRGVLSNI